MERISELADIFLPCDKALKIFCEAGSWSGRLNTQMLFIRMTYTFSISHTVVQKKGNLVLLWK